MAHGPAGSGAHLSTSPDRYLSATLRMRLWTWLKLTSKNCAWRSSSSSFSLVLAWVQRTQAAGPARMLASMRAPPPRLTFSAIMFRKASNTLSATAITHCIIPVTQGISGGTARRPRPRQGWPRSPGECCPSVASTALPPGPRLLLGAPTSPLQAPHKSAHERQRRESVCSLTKAGKRRLDQTFLLSAASTLTSACGSVPFLKSRSCH